MWPRTVTQQSGRPATWARLLATGALRSARGKLARRRPGWLSRQHDTSAASCSTSSWTSSNLRALAGSAGHATPAGTGRRRATTTGSSSISPTGAAIATAPRPSGNRRVRLRRQRQSRCRQRARQTTHAMRARTSTPDRAADRLRRTTAGWRQYGVIAPATAGVGGTLPWNDVQRGTGRAAASRRPLVARANPQIFFRRALKIVNGGQPACPRRPDDRRRESCLRPGQLQCDQRVRRDRGTRRRRHPRRCGDGALERLERHPLVQLAERDRQSRRPNHRIPHGHRRRQEASVRKAGVDRRRRPRHRRRRAQLPALHRGLERPDHQLSRLDRQLLHQPAGDRHLQVLRRRSTASLAADTISIRISCCRSCCRPARQCSATSTR